MIGGHNNTLRTKEDEQAKQTKLTKKKKQRVLQIPRNVLRGVHILLIRSIPTSIMEACLLIVL